MTVLRSRVLTEIELKKYSQKDLISMVIALQSIANARQNELEGYTALRNAVQSFLDRKCDETTLKRVMGAR